MTPFLRAIEQLDDPAMRRVLWQSLGLAAFCFGLLCYGSFAGIHHWLAHDGWLSWVAGALGGIAAAVASVWLFLPVAVVIAGLFMESVCRAVERRWYPGLPPPTPANTASQGFDGLVVGLRVLLLTVLILPLAFFPPLGLVLGWAVTAWALGRGLFVSVAMRRMSRRAATALYRRRRSAVLFQGAILTLAGTVPPLNLLVPVVGTAAMLHLLEQSAAEAATSRQGLQARSLK
jgi:uncharacterized protein involved in cysteine biosynthesis